jgi:hypothetical protein
MRRVLGVALVAAAAYAVPAQAQQAADDTGDMLGAARAEAPAVPAKLPALPLREAPAAEANLQRQEIREMPQQSAATAQVQRGSFWWVVGAIVVAAVIVSVLLS